MWLPFIPKHLRKDMLKYFHDAPTAGHLGFSRTDDIVRKRFYWPGLYHTVRYALPRMPTEESYSPTAGRSFSTCFSSLGVISSDYHNIFLQKE
ncbi:hypothetical protein AVEN_37633-1 [Araneus ventricosus]|uniref:Integrase zinc-binding domain-containing protein n=1 Tax=Araneus ventricosus TaxID=182803 RepID=A0A4Y2GN63_ARAVE|nr:hypothetical protein AVEN_37633-1 [Araneus ventricosus]